MELGGSGGEYSQYCCSGGPRIVAWACRVGASCARAGQLVGVGGMAYLIAPMVSWTVVGGQIRWAISSGMTYASLVFPSSSFVPAIESNAVPIQSTATSSAAATAARTTLTPAVHPPTPTTATSIGAVSPILTFVVGGEDISVVLWCYFSSFAFLPLPSPFFAPAALAAEKALGCELILSSLTSSSYHVQVLPRRGHV